jgi:hypothetical protein
MMPLERPPLWPREACRGGQGRVQIDGVFGSLIRCDASEPPFNATLKFYEGMHQVEASYFVAGSIHY